MEILVFYPSEASESLFFLFSVHPRARLSSFSCFLLIRGLGKLVFGNFYPSEASESLFFVFSTHPRPRKACFSCFLLIRGFGKVVFGNFCSAEASDGLFFHSAVAMKEKGGLGRFDLGKYKIHKIKKSFMRLRP